MLSLSQGKRKRTEKKKQKIGEKEILAQDCLCHVVLMVVKFSLNFGY